MGRQEFDREDERATRPHIRGNTEPLPRTRGEPGTPLRQDWRSGARPAARQRPARRFPSSRQEFVVWLQRGGWLLLSGLFGIVVIVVLGLIVLRPVRPLTGITGATQVPAGTLQTVLPVQSTVTPAAPTPAPGGSQGDGGAQFRVSGTASEGLLLRPEPNTDQLPIKTLPEGTTVTVIGPDSVGPDRVWKHIRDAAGTEGWAAADFLKPAEP